MHDRPLATLAWSPDCSRIAFIRPRRELRIVPVDGARSRVVAAGALDALVWILRIHARVEDGCYLRQLMPRVSSYEPRIPSAGSPSGIGLSSAPVVVTIQSWQVGPAKVTAHVESAIS